MKKDYTITLSYGQITKLIEALEWGSQDDVTPEDRQDPEYVLGMEILEACREAMK